VPNLEIPVLFLPLCSDFVPEYSCPRSRLFVVINLLVLKKSYSKLQSIFFRSLVLILCRHFLFLFVTMLLFYNEGRREDMESNKVWELSKVSERRALE
jgi:hypothetical protein